MKYDVFTQDLINGMYKELKSHNDHGLMEKISGIVKVNGWTQAEAAKRCGVTQPRVNDLLRGRIARFSIDALVNIASALGSKVRVTLENAA